MRTDRRRVSIVGLLQAAAVLTVVLSALTGFDIPHHNIELFSHFRLQYLAVSILLLLAFLALRYYAYVGVLTVTVAFNAAFVLPFYFAPPEAAGGTPLKFIHVNVHSTIPIQASLYDARNEHLQSVAELANQVTGKLVRTGDALGSDHLPLIVTLSL